MIGIGYDVHRFAPDRKLILGGVEIPNSLGLDGHSDADVLCHAIADALLGALGEPDIGHFFPPGDPACKGISSLEILRKCRKLIKQHNCSIINIDSSLVLEAPKILPHCKAMKANIAKALGIRPEKVGVKATTNEGMGFIGRGEGVAAMAVAQLDEESDIPF